MHPRFSKLRKLVALEQANWDEWVAKVWCQIENDAFEARENPSTSEQTVLNDLFGDSVQARTVDGGQHAVLLSSAQDSFASLRPFALLSRSGEVTHTTSPNIVRNAAEGTVVRLPDDSALIASVQWRTFAPNKPTKGIELFPLQCGAQADEASRALRGYPADSLCVLIFYAPDAARFRAWVKAGGERYSPELRPARRSGYWLAELPEDVTSKQASSAIIGAHVDRDFVAIRRHGAERICPHEVADFGGIVGCAGVFDSPLRRATADH